jgi:hypothetical protein
MYIKENIVISDSQPDILREAWVDNIQQYFADTATLRTETVSNTREQLLRIMLNNANMAQVPTKVTATRVHKELSCSKKQVQKHAYNQDCFREIRPAKKSRKLKQSSFQVKHNDLAKVTMNVI